MHTLRCFVMTAALFALVSTGAAFAQTTTTDLTGTTGTTGTTAAPAGSIAEQPSLPRNAVKTASGRSPATWVQGGIAAFTVRQNMALHQLGGGSPVQEVQSPRQTFILGAIDALFTTLDELIPALFGVTVTPSGGGLTVSAAATPSILSASGTVQLQATISGGTSPYTVAWTASPTTSTISNASAAATSATVAETTTFTVTVTDSSTPRKTGTANATVTVQATTANTLTVTASASASTAGLTLNATATGGTAPYVYQWTASTGVAITNSTAAQATTATPTVATTYTVTVTDSSTPAKKASATVSVPAGGSTPSSFSVAALSSPLVVTTGGQVTLSANPNNATGTVTYAWTASNTSATITAPTSASTTATVTETTLFTVTATDTASGRTASASVTVGVTSGTILSVTAAANPATGAAGTQVALTATPLGGAQPFTFTWSANPITAFSPSNTVQNTTATPSVTTTFTVTVKDANGDTASANVTFTVP